MLYAAMNPTGTTKNTKSHSSGPAAARPCSGQVPGSP